MTGAPCLGQTLSCIGHLDFRYKPGLFRTHHSGWSPGIVLGTGIHQSIINEKGSHQVHAFLQMGPDIPVNFPPETGFKIHNIQALSHLPLPSHHASSHRHHSVCIKALAPGRVSEFLEKNKCILSYRMKHCPPPPPYYHMSTFPARKEARKTQVI